MKKILLIIVILISSFSYYGAVNENGEKITSFENLTQDNEIERNERKEENVIAKNEITQEVEQKQKKIIQVIHKLFKVTQKTIKKKIIQRK